MSSFERNFSAFLDDANAEFDSAPKKAPRKDTQRFPCQACGGTGIYQGHRTHQEKAHCFDCRGKGYFLTDERTRAKAREKAKAKKQQAKQARAAEVSAFILEHRDLIGALSDHGHWNSFAASMLDQLGIGEAIHDPAFLPRRIRDIEAGFNFIGGKPLTENQIAACRRMLAKIDERRAAKKAEREAAKVEVDLAPIRAMFDQAIASGYKKPMYRANGLRLKPGRDGALYVLTEERMEYGQFGEQPGYEGKIAEGSFLPAKACAADTADKLKAIAADPKGEAIRHGRKTGRCSCCGRELTKHASIDAGIGPICAEKWGL